MHIQLAFKRFCLTNFLQKSFIFKEKGKYFLRERLAACFVGLQIKMSLESSKFDLRTAFTKEKI